nr:hypothetical protein [Tanacetum cinerariifolium]
MSRNTRLFNLIRLMLMALKDPAPEASKLSRRVNELLMSSVFDKANKDKKRWLDHSAWVLLMLMYPEAYTPDSSLSFENFFVRDKMSRDVITTEGEAMINSIQNGDQPLPVIAQVSLAGNAQNAPLTLKDLKQMRGSEYGEQDRHATILYEYETFKLLDTYLRYLQVINDLMKCGYKKDNCELNYKFLNNLQPEWKQYGSLDLDESSSSDEETIVEVAYYTSESESEYEFETSEYYDNSTNYGLFVNNDDDQEIFHDAIESASENFIENHIDSQKDYDKSKVDHNDSKEKEHLVDKLIRKFNHKIAKCQKLKHVVIDTHVECHEKYAKLYAERYEYMIRYSALCDTDKQHRKQIADQEVLFDKMNVQLVDLEKHVRDLKNTVLEKDFKIFEFEECVRNKDLEIEKCLERLNVCENKLHKMGQTNQTVHMIMPSKDILYNGRKGIGFENPRYFEKAKDLRPNLYDEKVIGLGYTSMFLTHSDEALEIKKFKRSRENKIEFAYDYGNLNASYVNEMINFEDDYFQKIINPDFEKIDSPFQQTSSLKAYVPNVTLEKIIIDSKDEVVSLLEKEKANLKTIESLTSKGFESSENAISESENQSEDDCLEVEKECDKVENPKVIALGMFKLSMSQSVSPISISKLSCNSKNVESKLKRKRRKRKSSKQNDKQKKKWSSNTSNVDLSFVSHFKLNKDVKRYSRKDLLSCNNSHLGETTSAYVYNDAMNVSCNTRMCELFDDNNFFIFDDESIVQICLWIIDSGCSKHMTGNHALLTNFVEKFLGTVRFGNNDFAVIASYGDVVIGSMTIKKVYYVEGLGHNLFSVGQFCDKGLEICLWIIDSGCLKHMTGNRALLMNFVEKFLGTVRFGNNDFAVIDGYGDVVIGSMTIKKVYYVEDGVDLLTGDRSSNLYTIALNEVASNSSSCPLAKASSSQSWLWHQRLSHLNFATINNLMKNNFVQGLPKMKFKKDHLCLAYEQGKIHRKHYKSKTAFASNKPLYLLHMDLCGPMRVQSINGKRHVLVVVDDYSRCYLLNDYEDVGKLKAKGDIGVFVGYSKESVAFRIYNKQTRESSSSSLNDDVQQSLEEVILPQTNTQLISNNIVPNVDEASTSHNVFNECLEDAYFDASTSFHDPSNVQTFYQPYPHENK